MKLHLITIILVEELLVRMFRENTMGDISTHFCSTMINQNFLIQLKSKCWSEMTTYIYICFPLIIGTNYSLGDNMFILFLSNGKRYNKKSDLAFH